VRFIAGMYPHVYQQFVSRVERTSLTTAAAPLTDKLVSRSQGRALDVAKVKRRRRHRLPALIHVTLNVVNKLVLSPEQLTTVHPQTDQWNVLAGLGARRRSCDAFFLLCYYSFVMHNTLV